MFLYGNWRGLPIPTRMKIAEQFGIPKTSSTHVVNNIVESDGYSISDIERNLSVENIKTFLGIVTAEPIETPMLWNMMVDKINHVPIPEDANIAIVLPPPVTNVVVNLQANPPKKRGRPKKNPQIEGTNPSGDGSPAKSA